ncbi:hypothetical protein Dimus_039211 [Dionaea muscipula]
MMSLFGIRSFDDMVHDVFDRIGDVPYRVALPPSLTDIHNMFHVSMLRKYVHDPTHVIDFAPLHVRDDMTYEEQPVDMLDYKEKVLRNKTVPFVKILWRNHAVEEATWERENEMREKYPHLFVGTFSFRVYIPFDLLSS